MGENDPLPTTTRNRYLGFTPEEIEALLAWLPTYNEPANTWERNIASIRRKLEALDNAR